MHPYLVITGPTATGKTRLATALCRRLHGEIISCDSRQVYRGMDIGTGKDLKDYGTGDNHIPYHLIDIADPGDEYNLYRFQCDFIDAFNLIEEKGNVPVLCGGTGLYLDAIVRKYDLTNVPPDRILRTRLESMSLDELVDELKSLGEVHNNTDTDDRKRAIRAIEIRMHEGDSTVDSSLLQALSPLILLLAPEDRQILRDRISARLEERLNSGLVDEVDCLLNKGVPLDMLEQYGLEYRYLAHYLIKRIDYKTMHESLETAIHQFASRQVRWFRRMERKGVSMIHIDSEAPFDEIISRVLKLWHTKLNKSLAQ